MSIPANGQVSMSNIQNVFGGTNPIFMSEYYANSPTNYTSNVVGIPNTGQLIKVSDFRGKSRGPVALYATGAALTCAFSVRIIVDTYTGPVFRIRRSSDNVQQDFYTDSTQSYLTTGAGNTGTTYSSWIGANVGYVYTWYDQSGNTRHATNTANNTTQPFIAVQSSKYVIQFSTANATELIIPSIQPNTVFSHFYNTNTTYGGTIVSTGDASSPPAYYDYQVRFGFGADKINSDQNYGDWYFTCGGTKLAYNNGVSTVSILTNAWNVLSLSSSAPVWYSPPSTAGVSYFRRIGRDGALANRSINGYMTEMIFHNTAQTATDMTNYYSKRLF